MGYYNQLEGNFSKAQEYYATLLESEPPIYIYPGYIQLLFSIKNYQKIVSLISLIDAHFQDDIDVQLLCAKSLEALGYNDRADKKILLAVQKHKHHPELTYQAIQVCIRHHEPDKALTMIDEYLEKSPAKGANFLFYYLKATLYLNINKKEIALDNIKQCLSLNPSFEQGWLFSGLLHELAGNIDEAVAGYTNFLQIVGHDANVEQQIMNLTLKRHNSRSNETVHVHLYEAVQAFNGKNFKKAQEFIDLYLSQNPSDRSARLLKIEILCAQKQTKYAVGLINTWIKQSMNEDWLRALHLLYAAGIERTLIEESFAALAHQNPKNLLTTLYYADILLKVKSHQRALVLLEKAYSLSADNSLREKIMYQIFLLHTDSHTNEALKKIALRAEQLPLTFSPLLNALAYYYATKGNDLKKAQVYSTKALALNKNNVHFLDTQALIWYKQGELHKAQELLYRLRQESPNDFFILKHIAKVEHKLGNYTQAFNALKQAYDKATQHQKNKCAKLLHDLTTLLAKNTY
jgi:tetratricopeptide (TPR) repeat protein